MLSHRDAISKIQSVGHFTGQTDFLPQNKKGEGGKELGYRRHKIGQELNIFIARYMVIHNIILPAYIYVLQFSTVKSLKNNSLSTHISQNIKRDYSLQLKKYSHIKYSMEGYRVPGLKTFSFT